MRNPLNPSLYQVNARVWLTELGRNRAGQARLDDFPDLEAQYERNGDELESRGLYLDLSPWQYHVFEMLSNARR